MRDKLIKYHRKASFYRFRKFCLGLSIVVGFAVIAAIPLSVSLASIRNNVNATAPTTQETVVAEEVVSASNSVE